MHWYYVQPTFDTRWQVLAEGDDRSLVFDDREAAVSSAQRDARGNFTSTGTPSGVRVWQGAYWRDDEVFAAGRGRRRG